MMMKKDLAAGLGISGSMVSRLAKRGMPVDSINAAQQWRERHLAMERMKDVRLWAGSGSPDAVLAVGSRDVAVESAPELGGELDEDEPVYGSDHLANYKIAASFEKRDDARVARIKRMQLEGLLCLVADVERQSYTEARIVRDTLLGALPTKLAPSLAVITDVFELEQALREGLRTALNGIVSDVEAQQK